MDGRKIPSHLENPFDNIIIDVASSANKHIRYWGITPNVVTLFSLLFGILASVLVFKDCFVWAACCVGISYFLDCMDGNLARMTNNVTEFGDWFDHILDIVKMSLLYAAVVFKNDILLKAKAVFCCITLVFDFLSHVHLGCQEKIKQVKDDGVLTILEPLCPNPDMIKYTRFVGVGTWMFSVIIMLLFLRII